MAIRTLPALSHCPCCMALGQTRLDGALASLAMARRPRPLRASAARARAFATAVHDDGLPKHQGPPHSARRHSPHRRRPRDREPPRDADHAWPAAVAPTPYEILGQAKGAPYQKKRFYALAKQYHPDLHHNVPVHLRGLPAAVLLERYRLLVAANDLLSDPARRHLYDTYGLGWEAEKAKDRGHEAFDRDALRTADRAWRSRPGSAARNATWEDWERWRRANGMEPTDPNGDGAKQQEQFMSNGGFAVVVLLFVFLGGWGQLLRAEGSGSTIVAMQDTRHQTISRTLREQQQAIAPLSRQDRVGSFLERREGWGYDAAPARRIGPPADGKGATGEQD